MIAPRGFVQLASLNPVSGQAARARPRSGCQDLVPRPPRLTASGSPVVAIVVTPWLPTGSLVGVPVATVIPVIRIAVEVVVADAPIPVEAPSRIPKVAGAPVIQR